MIDLLNSSIIYRCWKGLTRWFTASNTCKVLYILLGWCRNSAINGWITRYLARNSSLESSMTRRIFSGVFSFFDRLWDRLYAFGTACGSSSLVISFVRDNFIACSSLLPYALVILFFSVGFGAASLLLGSFNTVKAGLTVLGIVAALLLSVDKKKWKACFENSIFWRFALYIFD